MPIRTSEPKQNRHRWWGIATNDKRKEPFIEEAGKECVFVKTSRLSHFVTQGTYVAEWNVLSITGDVAEALSNIDNVTSETKARIEADINSEDFPKGLPIIEILSVDASATPPVVRKLNAFLEELFMKGEWDPDDAQRVGLDDVKMGCCIDCEPRVKSELRFYAKAGAPGNVAAS